MEEIKKHGGGRPKRPIELKKVHVSGYLDRGRMSQVTEIMARHEWTHSKTISKLIEVGLAHERDLQRPIIQAIQKQAA